MTKQGTGSIRRGMGILILAAFLGSQTMGCATTGESSGAAATGGAIGALVGGIIGYQEGGEKGALIGALAGAALGALIGHYYDKQVRTREQAMQQVGYTGSGDMLKLSQADLAPTEVAPGQKVRSRVEYDVVTEDPDKELPVTETRIIRYQGKPVSDPVKRTVKRASGGYSSAYEFKIPEKAAPGEYTLVTTLEAAGQRETAETPLVVRRI